MNSCDAAQSIATSISGHGVNGLMNNSMPLVSPLTTGSFIHPISSLYSPTASQEFMNGVGGLEKDIKMQLVFQENKIMLPFVADHNIPGKYYAFVNPTVSGFYQANLLGNIEETPLSLSMHPPKVNERAYIEFPEPANLTVEQIIDGHTAVIDEISSIKNDIKKIKESNQIEIVGYAGIGLGIGGIIIASIAISKTKK